MALPDPRGAHEEFTDDLVYFAARLAANPKTAHLAALVDEQVEAVDGAFDDLRSMRRAEIRARARRDFIDSDGDDRVADFRRALGGVVLHTHDAVQKTFRDGVKAVIAVTGVEQVSRLKVLRDGIDLALKSPGVLLDPKRDKIVAVLSEGRATVASYLSALSPAVDAWTKSVGDLGLAADKSRATQQLAYSRAGGALGLLRDILGGSRPGSYAYTRPGPTRRSGGVAEPEDADAESAQADGPEPVEPRR